MTVTRANFLENAVNALTVALKNSPVNEGKKKLALMQAGNYDETTVRSKVEKYVEDNPVSAAPTASPLACPAYMCHFVRVSASPAVYRNIFTQQ